MVDLFDRECNRIGSSFRAFRFQAGRCNRNKGAWVFVHYHELFMINFITSGVLKLQPRSYLIMLLYVAYVDITQVWLLSQFSRSRREVVLSLVFSLHFMEKWLDRTMTRKTNYHQTLKLRKTIEVPLVNCIKTKVLHQSGWCIDPRMSTTA